MAIVRELGIKGEKARGHEQPGIVVSFALERLAAAVVSQQQPKRAAHLLAAAEGLRDANGVPLPTADCAEHERSVAAVGEEAFADAWAEGRALSLDQAVEYALEQTNCG
jgi:hypothetical protein